MQAALPQNTAALEYYVGHASAFAMVVKPGALHVVRLPATPAEIFTAVQETVEGLSPRAVEDGLKAMLDAPDFDSERYDRARQKQWAGFRRQQRESSGKLNSMLIRPVEPALSGAPELVLVPHGVLHHLPFALLAPAGEPAATLLERLTLTVAPSATAWLRGHTTQAATIPSRALLLSSPQFPPEFPPHP